MMVAVRGSFCIASSCRISHLGIKPVNGGSPPKESRARAAVTVIMGVLDQTVASVLIFVVDMSLNVRKVADVIIMYVARARIVSCGLSCTITIIQPRWAMDE